MADMTKAIAPRSDQMNAEDLLSGPQTFTITAVQVRDSPDQPVWVTFAEFPKGRPFKPSKTVSRIMVVAWGPESDAYVGKRMTLYRDAGVSFGGQEVGGIRVSHMSGLQRPLKLALAVTKGRRGKYEVQPIPDGPAPSPIQALVAAFRVKGMTDGAQMLAYCRSVIRPALGSASDLTPAEIELVIEELHRPPRDPAPGGQPIPASGPLAGHVPTDEELEAAYEAEQARQAAEGGDRG